VDWARKALVAKDPRTEVRQFILRKFPLARKQNIQDSDALLESGMLDSQGVLEVVTFLEQEFSISVADEDLSAENFQTIDQIAVFVKGKTDQ
jgi:acyl carrier protein